MLSLRKTLNEARFSLPRNLLPGRLSVIQTPFVRCALIAVQVSAMISFRKSYFMNFFLIALDNRIDRG